jgi:hypothetical protein
MNLARGDTQRFNLNEGHALIDGTKTLISGECYGDVLIEAMALAPIQPSAFEVLAQDAHTVHVPRELHAWAVGDGHPFALFDIATDAADRIASAAPALGIEVGYECN